ncbi:D-sedoheptulose-7-phosphate isomerase [Mycobacterium lehmannii]|uniref:D-sedoheptulose-7-phosphate isomerase n=1 Tax=Mycobacterium lehmannii TaxID=2048550 RepID=UPI000B9449CB|nr:SIS domain-containing protein [Mycobacterium lehmannii]
MAQQFPGTDQASYATNFLYPFIDKQGSDAQALVVELVAAAEAIAAESASLRHATLQECEPLVAAASAEMARRFAAGGRLFTFGHGGSSTGAATLAALFATPPHGQPLPAWSLSADAAVLTALGYDVGFELLFARQLIARTAPSDIAIAITTSGDSADLGTALGEAHRRGLYTIGFAGYDGGAFADNPDVDTCFTVQSQNVHRIQEAQALLGYHLWATTQAQAGMR